MAQVFPSRLPSYILSDPLRGAEVEIYKRLSQMDNIWTVLYSAKWTGCPTLATPNPDGEADFIVMHPRHGILVLEVKGGLMTFDGHFWLQNGKQLDKSPFEQVSRNCYAIKEKIRKILKLHPQSHINEVFHAVVFPRCVTPRTPLVEESPPELIIDQTQLARLEARLLEIINFSRNQFFSEEKLETYIPAVRDAFAKQIKFENPLATELAEEERQIANLTEAQFKAVAQMRRYKRCSICGGAGTGKTLLAVMEAERLQRMGERTALLCFHAPLSSYLKARGLAIEFVGTFHEFCRMVLKEADLPVPQDPSELADAVCSAAAKEATSNFGAIVVDEGQDFVDEWWVALSDALEPEGFLRVFFDNNQRVQAEGRIPDEFLPAVYLDDNIRNTRAIHRWFQPFYQSDSESLPAGPAGRNVERLSLEKSDRTLDVLGKTIHRLITLNRVDSQDIVVLTARGKESTRLANNARIGAFTLVSQAPGGKHEVRWETIRRFKGLEAGVVVVVEIEESTLNNPLRDAMLYVAFSRARSHLVVIAEEAILKQIEAGCQ